MKKVLLIDNYDSFTHILGHYLEMAGGAVHIYKNNEIHLSEAKSLNPDYLVISPGPGRPDNLNDIGNTQIIFDYFSRRIPVLGVCLGHQFIGHFFGGEIVNAPMVMHGKVSLIQHDGTGLFEDIVSPLEVMRYHSLIVNSCNFPPILKIDAETSDRTIMAFSHIKMPLFGIQFHPESIGTEQGLHIIQNFLKKRAL